MRAEIYASEVHCHSIRSFMSLFRGVGSQVLHCIILLYHCHMHQILYNHDLKTQVKYIQYISIASGISRPFSSSLSYLILMTFLQVGQGEPYSEKRGHTSACSLLPSLPWRTWSISGRCSPLHHGLPPPPLAIARSPVMLKQNPPYMCTRRGE